MLKQFWEVKHLTWGMPPKNSEGSSKFPGGHKVIDRTAQTAFVRVVTPRNFTFVIFNSGFFLVGKFDKYFLDTLIKKGFIWLIKTI